MERNRNSHRTADFISVKKMPKPLIDLSGGIFILAFFCKAEVQPFCQSKPGESVR